MDWKVANKKIWLASRRCRWTLAGVSAVAGRFFGSAVGPTPSQERILESRTQEKMFTDFADQTALSWEAEDVYLPRLSLAVLRLDTFLPPVGIGATD